ncbi:hypothetical protein LMG28688_03212 [Paraburkholderia caffeinitolerans]|uniref:Uncharacterized protein n=2 Tax=Paraburkholderia caffeinitolerans TaxID=1723730 RepID=A0A6J5G2F3_9BURK|nr:hypothetical protein LMG28688_03212 [Paraburkholderia caffeinitolerans]
MPSMMPMIFDDGHVGQIEAAYLIDALRDLEEPVDPVQADLAPQGRVRGGRGLFGIEKAVVGETPDEATVGIAHFRIGNGTDEAPVCFGFVEVVLHRQLAQCALMRRNGGGGGSGLCIGLVCSRHRLI